MSHEHDPASRPPVEALFEEYTAELLADQLQRLKNAYDFLKQTNPESGLASDDMNIKGIYTLDEQGDVIQLPEKILEVRILPGDSGATYMRASLHSKPSAEDNRAAGIQGDETLDFKEAAFQVVLTSSGRVREFHSRAEESSKYNWYDILSTTTQRLEDAVEKRLRMFSGQ